MPFRSEAAGTRSYFHVGGEYKNTSLGHMLFGQMYVEKLSPASGPTQEYPLVLIHGAGQTGTNWLNKPDGGRGWASWFLDHGYEVYIVDQPHTGRSACIPNDGASQAVFPAEFIQYRFTAVAKYSRWPQAHLHSQWPGVSKIHIPMHDSALANDPRTGMMGDPIFDAYYASTAQALSNSPQQERSLQVAGAALLDKIGPAVLITHSQGGLAGWSWADARPQLVKALVQIEPRGPPFKEVIFSEKFTRPWGLTSIPLTYSSSSTVEASAPLETKLVKATSDTRSDYILQSEPAKQLVNLKEVPILIVTAEASYHAMYDYCFVEFLMQAGCTKVEHLELAKAGILGNGHLMFLEQNSDVIAAELEKWISRTVPSDAQDL